MFTAFIVILSLACVFFGIVFIKKSERDELGSAAVFKGLTTLCILAVCAIAYYRATDRTLALMCLFGLFFGLVGDELLALRFVLKERFKTLFVTGAAAFFVGHIFYISVIYTLAHKAGRFALPLLVLVLLFELRNKKVHRLDMGSLEIPMMCYGGVVCIMGCSAVGAAITAFSPATLLFAVGGALFVASDSILSVQCFSDHPSNGKNRVLHLLYWLAQLCIALTPIFI